MLHFQLSQKNVPPLVNDKVQWASGGGGGGGARRKSVERENDALL